MKMMALYRHGFVAAICVGLTACSSGGDSKTSRKQSADNLRQIGLALHMYHDKEGRFPGPGKLSWRVAILPYLRAEAGVRDKAAAELHDKFKQNEAWDSPHNRALIAEMPKVFEDPRFPADKGMTYYQGFKGLGAVLGGPEPVKLIAISNTNGTGNTLLVVEAGAPVPWTKPEDVPLDAMNLGGPKNQNFLGLFVDNNVHLLPTNWSDLRRAADWSNTISFGPPPTLEDK